MPAPFIESLTHDTIVMQIPYLKGRIRSRLERLLNLFDQDYQLKGDEHLLEFDEEKLQGNDEQLVMYRLVKAAGWRAEKIAGHLRMTKSLPQFTQFENFLTNFIVPAIRHFSFKSRSRKYSPQKSTRPRQNIRASRIFTPVPAKIQDAHFRDKINKTYL